MFISVYRFFRFQDRLEGCTWYAGSDQVHRFRNIICLIDTLLYVIQVDFRLPYRLLVGDGHFNHDDWIPSEIMWCITIEMVMSFGLTSNIHALNSLHL